MCSGRPLIRLAHAGRCHCSGRSTVRPPPPICWLQLGAPCRWVTGGVLLKVWECQFPPLEKGGAIHLPPAGWVWGYQAIRCAARNSPAIFKTLFSPLRIRIHTELLLRARPYARLGPRFITLYACYHQRQPESLPVPMHQETTAPRKQTLTRVSVRAGFPRTLLSLLPLSPEIHAARGAGLFKNLKLKGTVSGNCYESRERNLMLGEKFSWHFLKILIENLFKHPGLSSRWWNI